MNCTGEMSGTIPIDFTCFNMSGVYLNSGRIISYDNIIDSSLFSADFTVEIPDYVNRYAGGDGIEFTITPCGVAADTEGYSYDSLMNIENGLLAGKAYIKLKTARPSAAVRNIPRHITSVTASADILPLTRAISAQALNIPLTPMMWNICM